MLKGSLLPVEVRCSQCSTEVHHLIGCDQLDENHRCNYNNSSFCPVFHICGSCYSQYCSSERDGLLSILPSVVLSVFSTLVVFVYVFSQYPLYFVSLIGFMRCVWLRLKLCSYSTPDILFCFYLMLSSSCTVVFSIFFEQFCQHILLEFPLLFLIFILAILGGFACLLLQFHDLSTFYRNESINVFPQKLTTQIVSK